MRNFLIILLSSLIMSFSFGQDKSSNIKTPKGDLKKQCVEVVNYLQKELKLDDKQKAIFMNAFSEYANNMTKAIKKTAKTESAGKDKNPKQVHQYMLRFSTKRDQMLKDCLKRRQLAIYDEFIKDIHPFTLEVRPRKKKKK